MFCRVHCPLVLIIQVSFMFQTFCHSVSPISTTFQRLATNGDEEFFVMKTSGKISAAFTVLAGVPSAPLGFGIHVLLIYLACAGGSKSSGSWRTYSLHSFLVMFPCASCPATAVFSRINEGFRMYHFARCFFDYPLNIYAVTQPIPLMYSSIRCSYIVDYGLSCRYWL
ncbi:hypothetical protein DFH07DRAFT_823695 [Mycena maculata]|uniref:Uncharacterized protein n=1 Tax=Mycena maculata TaxID=230809 RepID=A0AAD7J118_9AGAR|nr:hypothetical protein DFH07DRAFT_823695 [Mycena maculata]